MRNAARILAMPVLLSSLLTAPLILSSCFGKGCDEGDNISSQVVVESAALASDRFGHCEIQGAVFNNAEIQAHVQLRVFEVNGRRARDAFAGVLSGFPVPARAKARYSTGSISRQGSNPATFLPCSQIARFELAEVKATENPHCWSCCLP
jgi:hypothetical protein